MRNYLQKYSLCGLLALSWGLTGCSDSSDTIEENPLLGELTPSEDVFGKATGNFTAEEWYPGGQLGTTEKASYSAATPAVVNMAGMESDFNTGEDFFEHLYTFEQEPRKGLGPAWVRNSCIACHPSYGHGKRQTEYRANQIGNGYLLVIYHPDDNSYISEVTGMPQTQAAAPFKAPIDESLISIEWKTVTAMESGLPMQFEDEGGYSLIYPEVRIPQEAFNTNPKPSNYDVRLESTIGIYGTALLDAISDEDIEAQWKSESRFVTLNPAMWDNEAKTFKPAAYYSAKYNDTGKHHGDHGPLKRFTYAMTRGSLQDGAGSNAIWNITNVSRSDRNWLYTTSAWAQAMSEDPDVIASIKADPSSPYYADGSEAKIADAVRNLLDPSTNQFDNQWHKFAPEMNDKQYYQFMVWHRGLAVPAARNLNSSDVQRGKELFSQIGCAQCHRPSWTTGKDDMWIDASIKAYAKSIGKDANQLLPRYPRQTIWPYTDMVQHRLFMMNDIRTGWCRTTPLWGRGLSRRLTGADDRLHDCRARTVVEAIMWHGYSKQSDAYRATEKFYHLKKADRDAVVKFIESI
jgi:mono/diheme cytochrome c family protein